MILEIAILNVKPGQEAAFEATMAEATPLIAGMKGFQGLEVRRCVEAENRYLLEVRWDRLEDHTEGFRASPEYQEWKARLHHFYAPFPVVEHYGAPLITA
jgi:heme-degrading monooxygenase HmoA